MPLLQELSILRVSRYAAAVCSVQSAPLQALGGGGGVNKAEILAAVSWPYVKAGSFIHPTVDSAL